MSSKAKELESRLNKLSLKNPKNIAIALMGCMVNGPGEAKHADLGVAFGKNKGIFFKKGKIIDTISQESCIDKLLSEISGGR